MPLITETIQEVIDNPPTIHKYDEFVDANMFYVVLFATLVIYTLRKPLLFVFGLFFKLTLASAFVYLCYTVMK